MNSSLPYDLMKKSRLFRSPLPEQTHHHPPSTTSQSVSLSPLAHRRPVLGVFILRLSCDLKRRTPPLGERVHTLPQPGHSTRATLLSSKRWRGICTTPENVH